MKIKYIYQVILGLLCLSVSEVISDTGDNSLSKSAEEKVEKKIKGTNLALVVPEVSDLALYRDGKGGQAVSTNNKLLFTKFKNDENETELSFYKDGFCFSFERLDASGVVVYKTYSILDDKGAELFSYIDLDGDGLFDKLIDHKKRKVILLKIDASGRK